MFAGDDSELQVSHRRTDIAQLAVYRGVQIAFNPRHGHMDRQVDAVFKRRPGNIFRIGLETDRGGGVLQARGQNPGRAFAGCRHLGLPQGQSSKCRLGRAGQLHQPVGPYGHVAD